MSINPAETAEQADPSHTADSHDDRFASVSHSEPLGSFLEFYGMHQNPFPDAVNPAFFYQTDRHAEALRRMKMAVEHDVSLAMVTGPSGTGKTLVSQILLGQLDPERYEPILLLVTPGMSRTAMLREILSELNIALPVGINRTQELLKLLSNHIIDLYHQGRKLVLIIDECHFLSSDNLHLVRTISNIEIPERKLTTSLLFGESRFVRRLAHPSYDSLRNRMYFRGELDAMGVDECSQYVKFRLMVAGRLEQLFTDDGLAALHARAEGVNRSVNKLGMMCLIEGAALELNELDAAHVEQFADAM